jgi:Tfp pilus assembly protein PilF
MRIRRLLTVACFAAAALAAGGCSSSGEAKPTERELAQKRWAAARAGVMVTLAKDQYRNGQFDKARKSADEALRLSPENAQAHLVSARLLIEKGQLEAAEQALATARRITPDDGEGYYLSGVVMQRWQKHDQAYEQYKAAAERSPAELAYVLAEAEALVTLDRQPDALALLQKKADYFEHSGTIRDAIGQLLMQQGKLVEAARAFRQASVLSEDEPAIKERLALALYKTNQHREAADVLAKLVQTEAYAKRADVFALLGECQLATGRPRDARVTFESATQLDPLAAAAWRGLGRAALETNDDRRAELALTKALRFEPDRPETHLLLGCLAMKQDKLDAALVSFVAANKLDPRDTVTLCMVGYVLEKQKKPQAAAKWYARALQVRPGDEMARKLMVGVDVNE